MYRTEVSETILAQELVSSRTSKGETRCPPLVTTPAADNTEAVSGGSWQESVLKYCSSIRITETANKLMKRHSPSTGSNSYCLATPDSSLSSSSPGTSSSGSVVQRWWPSSSLAPAPPGEAMISSREGTGRVSCRLGPELERTGGRTYSRNGSASSTGLESLVIRLTILLKVSTSSTINLLMPSALSSFSNPKSNFCWHSGSSAGSCQTAR